MTFPEQAPRRRDLRRRDRGRPRRRRRVVVELLVVATGLAAAAVAAPLVLAPDPADGLAAAPGAGLEQRLWDAVSRSGGRAELSDASATPTAPTPATASATPTQTPAPTATDAPAAPPAAGTPPPSGGSSPAPAPSSAPAAAPAPRPVDAEIVALGNDARRAQGAGDLTVSACAQQQALARATLLVAEGRFEHDPLEPILAACGGRTVGENLALGYPTAKATVDAWLASPGHRANLLSKDFTSIGVACVDSARGLLCAQVFLG
ncbi:CAP domain-containing protein [Cellulomonas sp. H30R-01]|uniref:CAP domain-containing protein n=1 Tax=Cellulomonas sp. H30R-01 TaxID=2704467 RepID=UPI00138C8A75|nr:CAP domain-containing protein [Cellulomonas sp. H30R-01]QHT56806.1 CAP domain-containing protein [Cellulomonas sp. H30R-01]